MKSDTPDELFVFPDSSSLGPNCVLLSSEAQSPVCPTAQILDSELIFQDTGSLRPLYDRYKYGFPEFQPKFKFFFDDLPF